jgi:uncharacterized RDD family membrane protein YckC
VELDDQITLATPEGVELQVVLAGLGSRFIAGAFDLILQALAIVILAVITGLFSGGLHGALVVVFIVAQFVIWFFYPVLFEVLAAGRTLGKRVTHLRVVRTSGAPVDVAASAIRNLMRLIDGPPLLYVPTMISIAVTKRNQRLGDLAAGTLVIRDNPPGRRETTAWDAAAAAGMHGADGWDASAVSSEEVAAVRRFLERREGLEAPARRELAIRLTRALRGKVSGAPDHLDPEDFLEALAAHKRRR